ncbi:MAG TPA: hypothetical protein VHD86_17555 [Xanthobacteraceae bacterium]|nr:hypothetical protein [Xanthobacteraceae bacterium]
MLLGDLLAQFDDEGVATEAVLGLGDLALAAKLRAAAEADGLTLGAYAAAAVRHYAAAASDEEWVSLMGALGRAQDPGMVCLRRALDYVAAAFNASAGAATAIAPDTHGPSLRSHS